MANIEEGQLDPEQENAKKQEDLNKREQDEAGKNKPSEDPRRKGLLPETIRRLDKGIITIEDVMREQKRLKAEAERELLELRKQPHLLDEKEHSEILKELEEKKDPKQRQEILDRVKRIPEKKEEELRQNKNEERILGKDHKLIKDKKQEISKMFSTPEVTKWLGTKQTKQYETWAFEAIDKTASIANAKSVIKRMQEDPRDGIKPRREFFEKTLEPMLKKYGLTLNDTPYYKEEGLSERKTAMELAKRAEKKLNGMRNTGLYSQKAVDEIMKELLKGKTLSEQKDTAQKIEHTTAKEAEQFTGMNSSVFDEQMEVNGVRLKKMSARSKKLYLDFYKNAGLKDRSEMVLNWKKVIENEVVLVKELGEVFKDDRKGFIKALKIFDKLDFMEREKFIQDQRILIADQDKKTVEQSREIVDKATSAIDASREKKFISNTTAKKFKGLFIDSKNFINPTTKKIDLDKLQKMYDKLTAPKPEFARENRNLKAYEVERARFMTLYGVLKRDNPDINPEELKRWVERYDDETFHGRTKLYQDLEKEIKDKKEKKLKAKQERKEAGITDQEVREAKEKVPERSELIVFVKDCLAEDTEESIKEAYRMLKLYHAANAEEAENDKTFLYLEEVVSRKKREMLGSSKLKVTEEKEEKMARAVERVAQEQTMKEKIDEANIREMNIEETRRSQQRHKVTSARERAKMESLDKAGSDTDKKQIIENYYELSEQKGILKTEGRETGEEMTEIKFNNVKMTREQIEKQKHTLRANRDRITKQKGFKHVEIKDDKQRELKAEEAKQRDDKLQEKLDQEIVAKAEKIVGIKRKVEKPGKDFSDVSDQVAMMRQARRVKKEKKDEMMRQAA
ncbi:MAG: hypothetical protein WC269_01350 [Candidatus Gracilibacteria bacterium]|jgi:hypothetical protein